MVPRNRAAGPRAVIQTESPENVGERFRVAAVERVTVMNLDYGIESVLVSGRPFDNFFAWDIGLEQQSEVGQHGAGAESAGLIPRDGLPPTGKVRNSRAYGWRRR